MNNNFCVIMAGGIGSRFWPLSRKAHPKQFIDILGTGRTLIQDTYDRFKTIVPDENFLVVTNSIYKELVLKQLPFLSENQILLEPLRRNTAPCILFANKVIEKKNPNANIVVTPADHLVLDRTEFRRVISKGLEHTAKNSDLLTIGIKPNKPATGYGYIQRGKKIPLEGQLLFQVNNFTEKPNEELATLFLESGEFFWNSGVFMWSLETIQKAFETHLPDLYQMFSEKNDDFGTEKQKEAVDHIYSESENISIDYGIMEKSKNVCVLPADFGWSDLGTWSSMYENAQKDDNQNVKNTNQIHLFNSKNNIFKVPDNKMVIAQGLEGFIVAESEGTLLICKKDKENTIQHLVVEVENNINESIQ